MISGDVRAAAGAKGEFYEMLRLFHPFWERIDVVCPRTREARPRTLFDRVRLHPAGRYCYPDPRAKLSQPWATRAAAEDLLKAGRTEGRTYDLMTIHEVPPFHVSLAALGLARKWGLPVVSELHHVEGFPIAADLPSRLRRAATGLWVRFLKDRVAAIRTVNGVEVPDYLKERGVPPERIKVLYSFDIDLDQFRPGPEDKDLDFLFVGRLVANKGITTFIRALSSVLDRHPGLKAVVVGQGPQAGQARALAFELHLEEAVRFIPWLRDRLELAQYYRRAKALCVCSFSEGGPNVALEAMACGTTCLAPSIGVLKEVLVPGENGLLTGHDPQSLARAMERILSEEGLAARLGQAGPATAAGFEARAIIEAYARGLQDIAREAGNGRSRVSSRSWP